MQGENETEQAEGAMGATVSIKVMTLGNAFGVGFVTNGQKDALTDRPP